MTPINNQISSLFSRAGTAVSSAYAGARSKWNQAGTAATNAFVNASVRLNAEETNLYLETAKGIAYPITRLTSWAAHSALSQLFPAEAPKPLMERAYVQAEKGLEAAKKQGVSIPALTPLTSAMPNALTSAPVAENTNWPERSEKAIRNLGQKLTSFTALLQMREWAGVKDASETDKGDLMELADRLGKDPKLSVWQLFKDRYHPSFFQKLKAGFFYVLFYPHLLGSTIDAYLEGFISIAKRKLTTEKDKTRNKVFKQLLSDLHVFLLGRYSATVDFSQGKSKTKISPTGEKTEVRTLEDLRDYNVEEQYQFDLTALCTFFSEALMEASSVSVPLVNKTLYKVPLLGWVLKAFEAFVNRFIIRKIIQANLPFILEESVKTSIDKSKPTNLPFSISIARFFRECLQDLQKKLSSNQTAAANGETQPIPGTEELLSNTLGELHTMIRLSPETGVIDLDRKIRELKNAKPGLFDSFDHNAETAVKNAIINSCHILFRYLHDSSRSGELFAKVLETTSDMFSKEERDAHTLQHTLDTEMEEIKRLGSETFGKILSSDVPQEIDNTIDSSLPVWMRGTSRNIYLSTDDLFKQHQQSASSSLREICKQVNEIERKIAALQANPSQTVHTEIAEILQNIRALTFRLKEEKKPDIAEPLAGLSAIDQDALSRKLSQFYQTLDALLNQHVLTLQTLQEKYSNAATTDRLLQELQIKKIERSGNWIEPLITLLKKLPSPEKIRSLKADAPHLNLLSTSLTKQLQKVKALNAISSHLAQIYTFEERKNPLKHLPWGYHPNASLTAIRKLLAGNSFSEEERVTLRALITNGSNLLKKRKELASEIERLLQRSNKEQNNVQIRALTLLSDSWINRAIQENLNEKDDIYQQMQATAIGLKEKSQELLVNIQNQATPLSPSLTPLREKSTAFATSLLASAFSPAMVAPLTGALTSFASHFIWSKPTDPLQNGSNIAPTSTGAKLATSGKILGALAVPMVGLALPQAAGKLATDAAAVGLSTMAGGYARNKVYSYIQDTIVAPKVHELFHGFLDLCFAKDGHLFKASFTSALKSGAHGLKKLAAEPQ